MDLLVVGGAADEQWLAVVAFVSGIAFANDRARPQTPLAPMAPASPSPDAAAAATGALGARHRSVARGFLGERPFVGPRRPVWNSDYGQATGCRLDLRTGGRRCTTC